MNRTATSEWMRSFRRSALEVIRLAGESTGDRRHTVMIETMKPSKMATDKPAPVKKRAPLNANLPRTGKMIIPVRAQMTGDLLCAPCEKKRSRAVERAAVTAVPRQPSNQPARQIRAKSSYG